MIRANQLTRIIQYGLLALVALMPFHAFLSVWLGSLTGYQTIIQAWKEVLLLVLAALAAVLVLRDPATRRQLRNLPVILAGAFAVTAAAVTAITMPSLTAIAFGAKTDLEFLVAFVLAVVVATPEFVKRLVIVILVSATIVIGFGLFQNTLLPPDFLTRYGYGPGTIPPNLPLDPAIETVRYGSTLGGPNQLGTYLMLPLALAAIVAIRHRRWLLLSLVPAGLIVLIGTHSRSAWVGALVAITVTAIVLTPAKFRLAAAGLLAVLGAIAAYAFSFLLGKGGDLQYYLLHSSTAWHGARGSDYEHLLSLQSGINQTLEQPLGRGLGTAGPATFRAGTNHIIENNYLQYSYETGVIGGLLFVGLVLSLIWGLIRRAAANDLAAATLAALAGISVTALVLPAWADSTTALVTWTAAGAALGLPVKKAVHPAKGKLTHV